MENNTYLVSNSPYTWETALLKTAGVAGNPNLAAGLLLGYFFLGLASFIWAFWSQRSRLHVFKESIVFSFSGQQGSLRGVQNIHNSLIVLFFMDIISAITAVILAIEFATSTCNGYSCVYTFTAWFLSRCFAVVFHLLCALVSVLFLCHPNLGAKLRCIVTLVSISIFVIVPFYIFLTRVAIFGLGVIIFGLTLAIIVKCAGSTTSPSAATWKKLIVFVAMLTVLIVYTPSFILECLMVSSANHGGQTDEYLMIYVNVLFGTNLHLLLDGLLCFFIFKLPAGEDVQQQQNSENPNYDTSEYVTT